ncbi:MAG: SpoIIE family protein phosphatase [SAR324 cluster bacterium]|nr:SpoIIE family protein phosphatase [SAR324 cluster bacterium]
MVTKSIKSTVLRCDNQGNILKVIKDELELVTTTPLISSIADMMDEGSVPKAANFLSEMTRQTVTMDWEMSVRHKGVVSTILFGGIQIEDELLIVATPRNRDLLGIIKEFAGITNEQANNLRSALKENVSLHSHMNTDNTLFEEISQLNNELVNIQRELAKKNAALENLNNQMVDELNQARLAQQAILPSYLPEVDGVKLATRYYPMTQIGGDFYDLFIDDAGKLGLLIGDVTGHGVPAALLSFMFLTTFRNSRQYTSAPDQVIELSNSFLTDKLPIGKNATVFYSLYNPDTRVLEFATASHPPGYLIRKGSKILEQLTTPGMVVGMFEKPKLPYRSNLVALNAGDKVVVYTDGIVEVMNPENRLLDPEILETFLIAQAQLPIGDLLDSIYQFSADYAGPRGFDDDVTLIGLEVK